MSTSDNSVEETAVRVETKGALSEWLGGWAGGLLIFYTIVVVGHISYCLFHWGGDEYAATVSDWICQISYLGPFLYAFRTWRHPALSDRTRRAWLLIGLAHLGLFTGQCLWTYFELGLGIAPFPSWADAGYLSYFPLMLPGLLYVVERMQSKEERFGFALDSAIVLVSGSLVIWYFLLLPMANAADDDTLKTILSFAYPVGDIVLLLGISSLVLRRPVLLGKGPITFLLIGVIGNFAADFWFGYVNLQGTYKTGDLVDSLYTVALFPIIIAAHYQHILSSRESGTEKEIVVKRQARSIILLPYAALGIAYGVLVWIGINDYQISPGVEIIVAAVLTCLVLTRQYLFIRENRRVNAAVTELQERIQGIYSAATDGIAVADFDGKFLEVNDAIVKLTGYSREELTGGMTTYELTSPEHVEATRSTAATVIATHEPAEYEKEMVRKDGTKFTAMVTVFAIRSSAGIPAALAAIVRDVTERHLTEKRIQESEERWQLALRINDDGIWDWDIRNKRYFYSPRWREMFGFDETDFIDGTPQNIDQYFHPDDRHLAYEINDYLHEVKDDPYFDVEFRHLCKDGCYKWIRCRGEAIFHPETGRIERMIGLNTDIEHKKRAEFEREAIRAILQGVSETSNLDELLALIHRSIGSVINADNCFVALYDKPSRCFKMQFFVDQFDVPPPPTDLTGTRTHYVFNSEMPLFLDEEETKRLEREGAFRLVGTQPKFWLGTPLKTPNEVIGVLVVQIYDEQHSYTPRDLEFLNSIAGQIALAIERKMAEDALRLSEEKHRVLFESNPFPVYVYDIETLRFLAVNEATIDHYGHTRDEFLNRLTLKDLRPAEDHDELMERIARVTSERDTIAAPSRHKKSDGTLIDIELTSHVLDFGGRQAEIVLINDITERKAAEEEMLSLNRQLKIQSERFNDILENTPCVIWETPLDPNSGMRSFVNAYIKDMYGYSPEEWLGTPDFWSSVIHPEDGEEMFRSQDALFSSGRGSNTSRWITKDGRTIWGESHIVVVHDESGSPIGLRGVTTDITEHMIAEEQLKLFNEKLQRSNRELQDFAYVASHDLQEPLRKVQTFADRLTTKYAESLEGNGLDYLERMRNAASRMQTLIQDLLSFSRVTTKAQPFVSVDLEQITQDVLSDLEVKIEETGATVETHGLPKIDADPLQMRQLIQNLVGNALKFRQPDVAPVVKISATNGRSNGSGPIYTITVEDNGIGFDEKYLDKIFTVFQRLHGRAEYEGSGIGLAVCRKIVERHHGTLTAESKPGAGAKFIFSLPGHQQNAEVH